jgi:hypothetical protein
MQNNFWYNYEVGDENNEFSPYSKDFINNHTSFLKPKLSLKYYLMALQEAKGEELAGMCSYMAWVASNRINRSETNPYLKHLENKHLGTFYYDKYSNCELVNTFFDKYYRN